MVLPMIKPAGTPDQRHATCVDTESVLFVYERAVRRWSSICVDKIFNADKKKVVLTVYPSVLKNMDNYERIFRSSSTSH